MKWTKYQVDEYFKVMEASDNSFVINTFKNEVEVGSKVLELGFGCGKDYNDLKDFYQFTLSDYSDEFVERFNSRNQDRALVLDAKTLDIDSKFDVIYSNKVLQVFNDQEMMISFSRQAEVLKDDGIIFHTLWLGDSAFESDNYYCNYVNIKRIERMLANKFHIVTLIKYTEMEVDDSIIVIAKKIS